MIAMISPEAVAKDETVCPKGLICASDPETVASGMKKAGFRAELGTDATGDPKISSSANGFDFQIFFYGCEDHKQCDSLQFYLSFNNDDGKNSETLANNWNKKKRFVQMSYLDDKALEARYDVTTIGGINPANFSDIALWWDAMLGEMRVFFREDSSDGKK